MSVIVCSRAVHWNPCYHLRHPHTVRENKNIFAGLSGWQHLCQVFLTLQGTDNMSVREGAVRWIKVWITRELWLMGWVCVTPFDAAYWKGELCSLLAGMDLTYWDSVIICSTRGAGRNVEEGLSQVLFGNIDGTKLFLCLLFHLGNILGEQEKETDHNK